jgi:UDP-N-acetylglucosamine--N-acetylmuramyl-(pentapeptide) pyrophosphoryl-undecaprenol N-acetylglucosamine transferase
MTSPAPLVLIATGSSGGHVTPALAVAEALRESSRDVRTVFAGPAEGIAHKMVQRAGGEFLPLEVPPLRGSGSRRWMQGLAALPAAALRSRKSLRQLRPDVVMGTGAHTSGPLLAMAALDGISTLLFEANVEVGLANRWLRPMVKGAAVAWPQTVGAFPEKGFVSGCPVGRNFRAAASQDSDRADGRFHLLVLGGSGGSASLDRAMGEALPHLVELTSRLSVVHQASPATLSAVREGYERAGVQATVERFFPDLAEHYLRAELVLARAGGNTIAELAALGRPAILTPLPAAGDHQRANALAWEEAGCGRTLPPEDLSGESLAVAIRSLVEDGPVLVQMAEAARALHRPNAAHCVADWCLQSIKTS